MHFRVPKVIGERPHSARWALVARGLDVKFTALSNLCAGVPPNGRIIAQRPRAGTGIDRGQTVFLQTSCVPRAPHRPCRASQLDLAVGGQGSTGGFMVGVTVTHARGPACVLDPSVRLVVRRPAGTVAEPIHGNPATLRIHRRLGPRATLTGLWHWLNWCGSGHRFILSAEVGGARARRLVRAQSGEVSSMRMREQQETAPDC